MTNLVDQQLGNYRLTSLIGQDGFADVYLAEHLHLNTRAAIKVLQVRLGETSIEQFRIEARTIANHFNGDFNYLLYTPDRRCFTACT